MLYKLFPSTYKNAKSLATSTISMLGSTPHEQHSCTQQQHSIAGHRREGAERGAWSVEFRGLYVYFWKRIIARIVIFKLKSLRVSFAVKSYDAASAFHAGRHEDHHEGKEGRQRRRHGEDHP